MSRLVVSNYVHRRPARDLVSPEAHYRGYPIYGMGWHPFKDTKFIVDFSDGRGRDVREFASLAAAKAAIDEAEESSWDAADAGRVTGTDASLAQWEKAIARSKEKIEKALADGNKGLAARYREDMQYAMQRANVQRENENIKKIENDATAPSAGMTRQTQVGVLSLFSHGGMSLEEEMERHVRDRDLPRLILDIFRDEIARRRRNDGARDWSSNSRGAAWTVEGLGKKDDATLRNIAKYIGVEQKLPRDQLIVAIVAASNNYKAHDAAPPGEKEVSARGAGEVHPAWQRADGRLTMLCACPGSRRGTLANRCTVVGEGFGKVSCENFGGARDAGSGIAKGTTVRVRTTNGGELIGVLYSAYRPTYEVVLTANGREVVIAPERVSSVAPVSSAGDAAPDWAVAMQARVAERRAEAKRSEDRAAQRLDRVKALKKEAKKIGVTVYIGWDSNAEDAAKSARACWGLAGQYADDKPKFDEWCGNARRDDATADDRMQRLERTVQEHKTRRGARGQDADGYASPDFISERVGTRNWVKADRWTSRLREDYDYLIRPVEWAEIQAAWKRS